MHNFQELEVWKKAVDLTVKIYEITSKFPNEEKFGLISQIRRATISISSNIAEGAGRNSPKEFSHFLSISYSSSHEIYSQLLVSKKLNFISNKDLKLIINEINIIQKMIYGLKKSLLN